MGNKAYKMSKSGGKTSIRGMDMNRNGTSKLKKMGAKGPKMVGPSKKLRLGTNSQGTSNLMGVIGAK